MFTFAFSLFVTSFDLERFFFISMTEVLSPSLLLSASRAATLRRLLRTRVGLDNSEDILKLSDFSKLVILIEFIDL